MRIFYDHQVFSMQDAGGAARYHYELIAHLQGMPGVEIDAALGINNSIYPFSKLSTGATHIYGRRSPLHPGVPRYAVNEALATSLAATGGKYDIYHPTLYRAMPLVRRQRIVVTHHDCAHERFPEMFRNASLVIRNKRKLYSECDAIICVSESSRQDLLYFYGLDKSRTVVVHHGFTPLAREPRIDEHAGASSKPYVLYVGFRRTYKNFDRLLEAYFSSGVATGYDLIAVGGGDFSAEECKEIERMGLIGKVKNVRLVNDIALARLYSEAAAFVYPSLHEGFGFPPLEAMSMGCPVLASNTSSVPEICGDAVLPFDPTDTHSLSQALRSVLNDAELRQTLKTRGYNRIRRYSWVKAAEETFRVYQAAANRVSRAAAS